MSRYRQEIVENFYSMGARAVAAGNRGGPFAFVIPGEQHDPLAAAKLEELLLQGSVETIRCVIALKTGKTPQRRRDVEELEKLILDEAQAGKTAEQILHGVEDHGAKR